MNIEAYGPSPCPSLKIHTFPAIKHTPKGGWPAQKYWNLKKYKNFVEIFYEMFYIIFPSVEITTEINWWLVHWDFEKYNENLKKF